MLYLDIFICVLVCIVLVVSLCLLGLVVWDIFWSEREYYLQGKKDHEMFKELYERIEGKKWSGK